LSQRAQREISLSYTALDGVSEKHYATAVLLPIHIIRHTRLPWDASAGIMAHSLPLGFCSPPRRRPIMTTNPVITVPIALSCGRTATLTLPWFVQGTEYACEPATFQPLVNGEEAFGAIFDAIDNAKHTIDIICWGFQASMYFRRDGKSPCIGDLLIKKGQQGVVVRILCWNTVLPSGEKTGENNIPGYDLTGAPESEAAQRLYDRYWHEGKLSLDGLGMPLTYRVKNLVFRDALAPAPFTLALAEPVGKYVHGYPNVHFKTRGFSEDDRKAIYREVRDDRADPALSASAHLALTVAPTHHQKTVMIDYEHPELAVGFVMGHNMLDEYWDTNEHHDAPASAANQGRNGKHPRHDLSSRVTGPILQHLNANFCQAWDKETGDRLTVARAPAACALTLRRDGDTPVMAQLLRTQSQERQRNIEKMYLQAVNNATNFIYIENQYFRWPPLADKIKQAVQNQIKGGRDPAVHGPIYLFVVTNVNDEAIGDGTVNTYRMLDALGRADTIPNVAQKERADALTEQRRQLLGKLTQEIDSMPGPHDASARKASQARQQALQQQLDDVDRQIEDNDKGIVRSMEIDGLKVHVCSLVPKDMPPGKDWEQHYVYVHAKLMIVDDVFTTLGSANLNTRSMEVDSEINICHEHGGVTAPLRQKLWDIHTSGMGAQKDVAAAFNEWTNIIGQNRENRAKKLAPYASLVGFMYTGKKRTRSD
jgi:phosphatidylserine/phosphatidylglycerophosphate/cardiolipin synthase-like enzyme